MLAKIVDAARNAGAGDMLSLRAPNRGHDGECGTDMRRYRRLSFHREPSGWIAMTSLISLGRGPDDRDFEFRR